MITNTEITEFIAANIGSFHNARLKGLQALKNKLYTAIIEPLGHKAKERNEEFNSEYARIINNLVSIFVAKFCDKSGKINWSLLVEYNSKK